MLKLKVMKVQFDPIIGNTDIGNSPTSSIKYLSAKSVRILTSIFLHAKNKCHLMSIIPKNLNDKFYFFLN